jgi:hypothetical protein
MTVHPIFQIQILVSSLPALLRRKHSLLRGLRNDLLNHHGRPHSLTPAKVPKATLWERFLPILARIISTTEDTGGQPPQASFRLKVHAMTPLDTPQACRNNLIIHMLHLLTFLRHMLIRQ